MTDTTAANESMLEIAVNVVAAGHDLGGFEPVENADGKPNRYQAQCRRCGQTACVGDDGLMYSLLSNCCETQFQNLLN